MVLPRSLLGPAGAKEDAGQGDGARWNHPVALSLSLFGLENEEKESNLSVRPFPICSRLVSLITQASSGPLGAAEMEASGDLDPGSEAECKLL